MGKPQIKPKEPQHIDYGLAGEQPNTVWQSYNWTLIDSEKYRVVAK